MGQPVQNAPRLRALVGIVIAVAMGVILYGSRDLVLSGQGDFSPIYVATQLVGGDRLYDPAPYHEFHMAQFGATNEVLVYIRPPFYAALLQPLGWLPYERAHAVWMLLRIVALVGFVWLWRRHPRRTVIGAALICFPILGSMVNGQDGLFALLSIAGAWRLRDIGKPLQAGLILSLCAIKFHLFLTLPIWLLSRAGRPMLKGFSLGALVLLAISFAVAGLRWPVTYYELLTSSEVSPGTLQMPNLHGMLAGLPGETALYAVAIGLVGWACWKASAQQEPLYGFGAVLVGGLLTSHHAYFTDCMILLPAVLVVRASESPHWMRVLSLLVLLPIPLLLSRPSPYLVQGALVVMLLAMATRVEPKLEIA